MPDCDTSAAARQKSLTPPSGAVSSAGTAESRRRVYGAEAIASCPETIAARVFLGQSSTYTLKASLRVVSSEPDHAIGESVSMFLLPS